MTLPNPKVPYYHSRAPGDPEVVELWVRVTGANLPSVRTEEERFQQVRNLLLNTFAPNKQYFRHGSWLCVIGQLPYGRNDTDESVVHQISDDLSTDVILVTRNGFKCAGPTIKTPPPETRKRWPWSRVDSEQAE